METFAAVLTAVCFWAFFAYLTTGKRLEARKHAGQLLLKTTKKSFFGRFGQISYVIFAIAMLSFWGFLIIGSVFESNTIKSSTLLLGLFIVPQVGWSAIMMVINSRIDFRRHGIVTPTNSNWPLSFIPWSHIRYCKWLFSNNGVLLLQFQDRNEQIEVDFNEIDKITAVLIDHVETRDSSGKVINAKRLPFEYPDEPEPLKRHSLQFNLKTALLFMVVASAAFAWLGIHLRTGWQEQREQEALAQFKEFGVEVEYTNRLVDRLDFSKGTKNISDDNLRHLAAFRQLRHLCLSKMPITDSGLVHVKSLTSLEYLHLGSTQITDEGLVNVEKLPHLIALNLNDTQVGDAGLIHIKSLNSLGYLYLSNTQITDVGLAHIESLTNLENLHLHRTQVTDAGLIHLKPLTRIYFLGLSGTKVTDDGLMHLKGLAKLTELYLDNTQVTDAGLKHLEKLTRLEHYSLLETKVTKEGSAKLKKKLPKLKYACP